MSGGANPIFLFLIDFLALLVYTVNEGACVPVIEPNLFPELEGGRLIFCFREQRKPVGFYGLSLRYVGFDTASALGV